MSKASNVPIRLDPDLDGLKETVTRSLALAKSLGATQAESSASFGSGFSCTVRLREVETLEHHRDQGLGITVYFGQRKGSASTSDLRPAAVEESVRKACSLARYGAEDPAAGLADADRLATVFPELDLHHPWDITPESAIALATECEGAALAVDPRINNSEGATVSTHEGCRVYGNSHDFLGSSRESSHSLSVAVLASDGEHMERDFDYTTSRRPADLVSAAGVGAEAGRRTLARLGAVKLETRQAPVLFPARVARGLIGHYLGAVSGGALYRRASFLVGSDSQQIFASHVHLDERPHLLRGLASTAFDDEGVATKDRRLVDAGVVQGYVMGSYYGRKLGLASTGNAGGVHNIVVSSTGQDFATLMSQMDRGLVVTELMGQGVNPVTGDYSRGAAGFWVEQGRIQYPVSEITIAGNLKDMYRRIVAIGNDPDPRSSILTGSILLERMSIAGS
jgi:PmbA protein